MEPVNILEARNNLSRLIAQAVSGEEVVISNRGKPVVRLVPIEANEKRSTGAAIARWLTENPPLGASPIDLRERIREIREDWD
jgi:prevent-host-death family protein